MKEISLKFNVGMDVFAFTLEMLQQQLQVISWNVKKNKELERKQARALVTIG